MAKRLNGISKFLSYHGRLIPVNSVFSALPTFFMCSLITPHHSRSKLIDIENIAYEVVVISIEEGPTLATWELACRSKEEEGLGINLKTITLLCS
jgi:hypothetical protein